MERHAGKAHRSGERDGEKEGPESYVNKVDCHPTQKVRKRAQPCTARLSSVTGEVTCLLMHTSSVAKKILVGHSPALLPLLNDKRGHVRLLLPVTDMTAPKMVR